MSIEQHGQEAAQSGPPELPSFLDFMHIDMHQHVLGFSIHQWIPIIMSFILIGVIGTFVFIATRRLQKIPRGTQALLEIVVEGLESFCIQGIGDRGKVFTPLIGSFFIYILLLNLMGQIPLFHSPTANYNTTLALTLVTFFATQYVGIKNNGFFGYMKHFVGEPLWLSPLNFPLHLIQEVISRPLSLSMRLFGNVMGEHTVLAIFVGLAPFIFGVIPVPIQLPLLLLGLIASTMQALVFCILSCSYISGAIGHTGDEGH